MAISLSVYFYTQSKNTEATVSALLEGIRAQTDALQKIVGKQMGQLIRGVTEQPGGDISVVYEMISAIKEIPISVTTLLQAPSTSAQVAQQSAQQWRQESLKAYICTYYYSALANIGHQYYLPPLAQLQDNDFFKRVVDASHSDFITLDLWFSSLDEQELRQSPLHNLYKEALGWKPFVKDTTTVYRERTTSSPG
jgi:hypothetical protein